MSNDAFLILFLILLACMALFPLLFRRIKIPEVITLMIIGMVIGPNGIDLVGLLSEKLTIFGGTAAAINENAMTLINSLGSLGLLFLMTLAGMEADFKALDSSRKPVVMLSVMTFLIPAVSGFLVYKFFEADDLPGQLLYASLFASHSVGIVFPVIRQLNLTRTIFGVAVLISTVITDILSIILLAVSVQMKKVMNPDAAKGMVTKTLSIFDYIDPSIFGNTFIWVFLAIVTIYFIVVLYLTPKLGRLILKLLPNG
ncbi:MAG: cation:proton antiporter, partial [Lentisphaeria bacterium]|nr:cation:proton antiporter [Lentisphaeria bacterium]